MKVPYMIYTDFEAIIRKMQSCKRPKKYNSYTEKTGQHK